MAILIHLIWWYNAAVTEHCSLCFWSVRLPSHTCNVSQGGDPKGSTWPISACLHSVPWADQQSYSPALNWKTTVLPFSEYQFIVTMCEKLGLSSVLSLCFAVPKQVCAWKTQQWCYIGLLGQKGDQTLFLHITAVCWRRHGPACLLHSTSRPWVYNLRRGGNEK